MVGTTIDLSGTPFTVIGILGPSYRDPFPGASGSRNDLVVPLMMAGQISQMGNDLFTSRRSRFFSAIGKLREGVTVAQGDAELGEIAARLAALHPVNSGMTATVTSLDQQVTQQLRAPALVLLVGAVVLLAIACFNVANLLLVRGAGRRDELAVHVALGAGRLRLFRLLAIESGILALAGGGLGIAAAHIGLPAVLRLVPNQLPPTATVTVNLPVVLAALAVSLAAGVASGLVPAIRLSALDIRGALSGSGGVVGDRRGEGVRRALVVGEIATAMVLLATSVALVRSFQSVRVSDPGFVTENIVTVGINLPEATYGDEESMSLAARVLAERVGDAPGVEWAHVWGPGRPGLSFNFQTSVPDGAVVEAIAQAPLARRHSVTPGALEAMGIELVRGRTISPRDMADGPRVAVISESMAQALWPGQDPIGKRYHHFQPPGVSIPADRHWTVVGVVRDAQHGGRVARPGILLTTYDSYFPFTQRTSRSFTLLARTGAEDQAAAVRETIRAFDPNIPVLDMVTMADNFAQEESIARFAAQLMGAFGLASLVLAALGVYGVLTFAVADSVREIGLRTALGASRSRMLLHFLRYGLSISGVGVVAGGSSALLLAGTLKLALPIAPEIDGIAVCTAGFALLFVALAAGAAPAVRASRVPPAAALRGE